MTKSEIALELTKLISQRIISQEHDQQTYDLDYPKALAEAYNKIYNTICIADADK